MMSRFSARIPLLFAPLLALAACGGCAEPTPPALPPPSALPPPLAKVREIAQGFGERAGLVLVKDAYGDGATKLVYLDQGWGPPETLWYYHADQGSTLMSYDLLVHLEQADNQRPFIEPENLTRYRFLNQHATPSNPDALPVGLAHHGDKVGLTCAACHTSQINYRGTAMRIDGGPGLVDVTGFLHAIRSAIEATLGDPAKLGRLAAAMKGGEAAVRAALTEDQGWLASYESANRTTTPEGFARLDALTRIVNQTIRFSSDPKNSLPVTAPASFPELWDAPRHDFVQWVGFASNAEVGALARNTGEVVGVYGRIDVKHYETEDEAKKGYPSTAEANEIVAMEETLRKLQSPRWPEDVLPPIDRALARRGESLYTAQCVSCHALLDRADPGRKVVAMVTDIDVVGTDGNEAKVIAGTRVPSGKLQGAISPEGKKYGADMTALSLLGDLVVRALSAKPDAAIKALALSKVHGMAKSEKQGQHRKPTDKDPNADLLAYKARPLNGIWASAPYLHNGSIPNLHALLLPPAQRPATFSVGRWEYDPKNVGYVSDGQVPFVVDTTVSGNRNSGHEYGTKLTEDERLALVEYLKTL